MNERIKFRAWDKNQKEMTYISDFYWFEENGVHDGSGKGHYTDYELMQCIEFKDRNKTEIYDGDILKVPVVRKGSGYGNWWKETNLNHGFKGDYVYKVVDSHIEKQDFHETISRFKIKDLPITKKQLEEIKKPRGREKYEQAVDDYNYDIEDCEVIGNIYENPELLVL